MMLGWNVSRVIHSKYLCTFLEGATKAAGHTAPAHGRQRRHRHKSRTSSHYVRRPTALSASQLILVITFSCLAADI